MANKKREISTEKYLINILNEMKGNIERGLTIEENEEEAKLIENFLNMIGNPNNPDNIIESFSKNQMLEAINMLHMGNVQRFKEIGGVKFEDYLGRLVNRIMENAREKDLANQSKTLKYTINLGSQEVDFLKNISDDIIDESIKKTMIETYKSAKPKLDEDAVEAQKKIGIKSSVQGKIDTATRYIDFKVTTDNEILKKVLPLLANATFSDKAYLTSGDVSLGQTNPFRVFLAVTGEGTSVEKIHRQEKMLSCMDYHSNHKAALLFYQIRYMYELTGYGLQYVDNKITEALGTLGAKYFIYYHPSSGKVQVVSTASIINKFINAVRDDNMWVHKIKDINKSYALYAKLKMRMRQGQFEFGNYS